MSKIKLPEGWKLLDLYGDGEQIAVSADGKTSAWIEDDGTLAIGDSEGVAHGYVPLSLVDALRKDSP